MRLWFASLIAALALHSANAQFLYPESVHTALWGMFLGGALGGGRHCGWSGDGAAIGAGVGFVAGTLLGESRRRQEVSGYGYYTGPYAYSDCTGTYYRYGLRRPNYAVNGTLLGAASGALIGEGAAREPGKGAVIGAAAGLVLGSAAEHDARQHERQFVASTCRTPAAAACRRNLPWLAAGVSLHQIPDAPRVPDAPTF